MVTQYTDALARSAISLTTTGTSGAATYSSSTGAFNIPNYTLAGLGGIGLSSLSATTPLSYNNGTGAFSIQVANTSQAGYLSSTDWNTFNNKVSFPGFGTNHTTAAYGDHNHSGVYDNYGNWNLQSNGSAAGSVGSAYNVNFVSGDGMTVAVTGSPVTYSVTSTLNLAGLSTIVNPTQSYYIPTTSGSGNTKILVSTLESILGTTAGTASRLVMRDGSADAYAHNFILSSDRRLKKNIIDLPSTDWTNKIKFKQFQFKDDPKEKIRFGVIAQDIEKIAPELVSTDENGNKAVAYIDMLIAKVAEMDKKINTLTQKVEDLEFINEGQKELLNMKKVKRHAK